MYSLHRKLLDKNRKKCRILRMFFEFMNSELTKCLCVVSKHPDIKIMQYYKNFNLDLYLLTPIIPVQKIEGVNYILDIEVLDYSQFNFEKTSRPYWYYQQFLKLAVVLKLPYDYVHIIDGDTYLEENAINSINKIYYSRKKINYCYCNFNLKFGLPILQKNFVVNHMNFHKDTLISMFEEVFISWENILFNIDSDSWLSEYYSYANYVVASNKGVSLEKIKVFRRGDLLAKNCLVTLGKQYHIIAFEPQHHTNFFKRNVVRILFFFKCNLG